MVYWSRHRLWSPDLSSNPSSATFWLRALRQTLTPFSSRLPMANVKVISISWQELNKETLELLFGPE